ncbi:nucleosome assembly protein 1;4-like [Argentina anserina]|uniref:nucleosome assembly protein 1;4-like n=1 Tax=Argentina anserina TaxID=57926 RepID=UPI0021768470|nr:nucleosome assembly protein 1;4-like [Potentilla anserina]
MGEAPQTTQISAHPSTFLENVRECVESLRSIQFDRVPYSYSCALICAFRIGKYEALKSEFDKDRAAIYAYKVNSPQIYNIVNGDEADEDSPEPDGVNSDSEEEATFVNEKGVPNFWLYALQNNDEICYRDEQALEYLKDIRWSPIDYYKGFKLEFLFKTNPFFANSVLTKTYFMGDEDRSIVKDITGCPRKKANSRSKYAKAIDTTEACDSFFKFFNALEVDDVNLFGIKLSPMLFHGLPGRLLREMSR